MAAKVAKKGNKSDTKTKKNLKKDSSNEVSFTKHVSRKHKEKSKQRILNATAKLFAEKGFDGAGIREICHAADANICMVSYFWGGKKGLYNGIVQELIDRELQYAKKFLNLDIKLNKLKKQEKIDVLYDVLDKIIDFLYNGWISDDLYRFLLQEQQNKRIELNFLLFEHLKKILASILDKNIDERDVILKSVFLMSQAICAKVLPALSLDLLKQKDFKDNDIKIIRDNVKSYAKMIIGDI